jgi:NADPH-dependent 2,4-dienoyl-CoA reductase/sulfur reductase-like enzyme
MKASTAEIRPAVQKKKAVIVGGGVAGMMAAQTLVQRDHDVVLFEEKDQIGGRLPDICRLP